MTVGATITASKQGITLSFFSRSTDNIIKTKGVSSPVFNGRVAPFFDYSYVQFILMHYSINDKSSS